MNGGTRQRSDRLSPVVADLVKSFGESQLAAYAIYAGHMIEEAIARGDENKRFRDALMSRPVNCNTHNIVSMSIKGLGLPRLDDLVPTLQGFVKDHV